MERTLKLLHSPLKAVKVTDVRLAPAGPKQVPVLDPLAHPLGSFDLGKAAPETGAASVSFITEAVRLAEASLIDAMNSTMSTGFRLFLGTAEELAAIGITVRGITRIMPFFVPLAAVGLMIVMVSATVFHIARNEISSAITTFVLLALATFVAYGRWKIKPILPRATT